MKIKNPTLADKACPRLAHNRRYRHEYLVRTQEYAKFDKHFDSKYAD